MSMIDRWEGIDSFAAIAETGSFTRAATKLGISISQVSREISRLETRLGTQLLLRTTRRLALTEAGKLFEQRCRRLITERDAAFDAASSTQAVVSGHLRLTCPVAYGEKAIVPIINRFVTSFPEISVDIVLTNHLLDITTEGIDLAIRVGDKPNKRTGRTKLASRMLHCCASASYLEEHGAPTVLADLGAHECLQGSSDHWHFAVEGRNISIRPRVRWRCNSGFAVLEAAMHGLGICQLPDFYVEQHLRSGALVEVLTGFRPEKQDIWAVYPNREHQQYKLTALVDFIMHGLND